MLREPFHRSHQCFLFGREDEGRSPAPHVTSQKPRVPSSAASSSQTQQQYSQLGASPSLAPTCLSAAVSPPACQDSPCPTSAPKSSTWVASSTPAFCVTTPSAKSTSSSSPNGNTPLLIALDPPRHEARNLSQKLGIASIKLTGLSRKQTSATLHHPQHIATEADAHVRTTPAGPDALLHATDAD